MTPQDPLTQLQDIHLPEPVGWWPLAWGWWLLIALALVLLALALWRWQVRRYRQRYRREALALLAHIYHDSQSNQSEATTRRHYLQQVNQLLRRTALTALPQSVQPEVAGLSGQRWLEFLDQSADLSPAFGAGPGQVLAQGPYQPDPPVDIDALHLLAQRWIRQHRLSARQLPPVLTEVAHA